MTEYIQPPADNAPELRTLVGREDVTLSTGEVVTVRAYGFIEGMRVTRLAAGMLLDLRDLFGEFGQSGDISLNALSNVFSKDPSVLVQLLALACDRPTEWVESLNNEDGDLLLWAWWSLNADFFVRRLVLDATAKAAAKARAAGRASSGN